MLKDAALLHLDADAGRARRGLHPQGRLALQHPVAGRAAGLHRHPVLRAARRRRALGRLPAVLRADPLSPDAAGLPRRSTSGRGCAAGSTASRPRRCGGCMSSRDLLRRGVLLHVVAQSLLQRRYAGSGRNVRGSLADAGFDKRLIAEQRREADAGWSRGLDAAGGADRMGRLRPDPHLRCGRARGEGRLRPRAPPSTRRWRLAWDLGCNTGTFSRHRRAACRPRRGDGRRLDGDRAALPARARRRRRGARSCRWSSTSPTPRPARAGAALERKDLRRARRARPHALPGAGPPHRHHRQHPAARTFIDWLGEPRHGGGDRVRRPRGRDGRRRFWPTARTSTTTTPRKTSAACCRRSSSIRDEQSLKGGKRTIFFAETASTSCFRRSASGLNSAETTCATSPRSTGSCSTRIRPASSRERSSRSVASFVRRSTCSRIVSRNSCRVASSTLLVRHQLEEAAEREERRPQLVRRVGDELTAGAVELAEPAAHALERDREVAELVVARVDHRLVEAAAGDSLGRALEPQDPLRVQRCEQIARDDGEEQADQAGEEQSPLDQLQARDRVGERVAEQDHDALVLERDRHLGEAAAAPRRRCRARARDCASPPARPGRARRRATRTVFESPKTNGWFWRIE